MLRKEPSFSERSVILCLCLEESTISGFVCNRKVIVYQVSLCNRMI